MHVRYLHRRPWGAEYQSGTVCYMADPADDAGGEDDKGGQQDLPLDAKDDKKAEPKPKAVESEGEALRQLIKDQNDVIAKQRTELDKIQRNQRKADDDKRIASGELEKLLAERTADLDNAKKQLETFQAMEQDRADRLFQNLPDTAKAKLEEFAPTKDNGVTLDKWLKLLEAFAEDAGTGAGGEGGDKTAKGEMLPPPTGSGRRNRTDGEDTYTPTERGLELMEQYGISDEQIRKLHYGKSFARPDEEGGDERDHAGLNCFSNSVKDMVKNMQRVEGVQLTLKNAQARRS